MCLQHMCEYLSVAEIKCEGVCMRMHILTLPLRSCEKMASKLQCSTAVSPTATVVVAQMNSGSTELASGSVSNVTLCRSSTANIKVKPLLYNAVL